MSLGGETKTPFRMSPRLSNSLYIEIFASALKRIWSCYFGPKTMPKLPGCLGPCFSTWVHNGITWKKTAKMVLSEPQPRPIKQDLWGRSSGLVQGTFESCWVCDPTVQSRLEISALRKSSELSLTHSHFILHPSSFLVSLGLWRGAHTNVSLLPA